MKFTISANILFVGLAALMATLGYFAMASGHVIFAGAFLAGATLSGFCGAIFS